MFGSQGVIECCKHFEKWFIESEQTQTFVHTYFALFTVSQLGLQVCFLLNKNVISNLDNSIGPIVENGCKSFLQEGVIVQI